MLSAAEAITLPGTLFAFGSSTEITNNSPNSFKTLEAKLGEVIVSELRISLMLTNSMAC